MDLAHLRGGMEGACCRTRYPPDVFREPSRRSGGDGGRGALFLVMVGSSPPAPVALPQAMSFPPQYDAQRCHFAAVRAERQLVRTGVAENGECFNPPLAHASPRERRAFSCLPNFSEGMCAPGPGTQTRHSCRGRTRVRRECGTGEGGWHAPVGPRGRISAPRVPLNPT